MTSLSKDPVAPRRGDLGGAGATAASQDRPVSSSDHGPRACDDVSRVGGGSPIQQAGRLGRGWWAFATVVMGASMACRGPGEVVQDPRRTAAPEVALDAVGSGESPATTSNDGVLGLGGLSRRVLFDLSSLGDWETGVFGNPDDFDLTDNGVVIPQTSTLAGMTYRGEPPVSPYRLQVDVTKRYGDDFFCGLTFPVRDSHLTLVLGGWGGGVSGLSCIDGEDASDNFTKHVEYFPNGKRQTVVVDVTDERVVARVDGRVLVDADLRGRELGLRTEVLASRPLGIATFATSSLIHSVSVEASRIP